MVCENMCGKIHIFSAVTQAISGYEHIYILHIIKDHKETVSVVLIKMFSELETKS